jgi:hypothetical protein
LTSPFFAAESDTSFAECSAEPVVGPSTSVAGGDAKSRLGFVALRSIKSKKSRSFTYGREVPNRYVGTKPRRAAR